MIELSKDKGCVQLCNKSIKVDTVTPPKKSNIVLIGKDGEILLDNKSENVNLTTPILKCDGGSTGGTTDYNQLKNKPSINDVSLEGNKTLEDLGVQPKGNYATKAELGGKQDKGDYSTKDELTQALSQKQDKGDYALKSDIPDKLPSPSTIQFSGASTASYDGSTPVEVNIPKDNTEWVTNELGKKLTITNSIILAQTENLQYNYSNIVRYASGNNTVWNNNEIKNIADFYVGGYVLVPVIVQDSPNKRRIAILGQVDSKSASNCYIKGLGLIEDSKYMNTLGISGASVGQTLKIKEVDSQGRPLSYQAVTGGGGSGTDGVDGKDGGYYIPSVVNGLLIWSKSDPTMPDVESANIKGKDGTNGAPGKDGADGKNGADGFSPTASVSKAGSVATIVIKDKTGETSVQIHDGKNGKNGSPGKNGTNGKDGATGPQGEPGKDGIQGPQGIQGKPGKQGPQGNPGKDGYTPKKGVDYFDGKNGTNGTNGKDGHTPVKGVDYWTAKDKQEIINDVLNALPSVEGGIY